MPFHLSAICKLNSVLAKGLSRRKRRIEAVVKQVGIVISNVAHINSIMGPYDAEQ